MAERRYTMDDFRADKAHRERERARDGALVQVVLNERTAGALLRYLDRECDADVAEARRDIRLALRRV